MSTSPSDHLQVDDICDEFEQAWKDGHRPDITSYCNRLAGYNPVLAQELLAVDFYYRAKCNEAPSEVTYSTLLPSYVDVVTEFFGGQLPLVARNSVPCSHFGQLRKAVEDKIIPDQLAESLLRMTPPGESLLQTAKSTVRVPAAALTKLTNLLGASYTEPASRKGESDSEKVLEQVNKSEIDPGRHDFPGLSLRYQLKEVLGQGATAKVFKAYDTQMARLVAVKVLSNYDPTGTELMAAERTILPRLAHPGIVSVFDCGSLDDGRPYIVMEYVEGKTLAEIHPPMTTFRALNIVKACAEAVGFVHQCGIIHRDLKPSNVMIDRGGRPRLVDFGLAKPTHFDDRDYFGGTFDYASPEQLQDSLSDERSDVFSLGTMLYQLLCKKLPVSVTSEMTIAQIAEAKKASSLEGCDKLPIAIAAIIRKCLCPDPSSRYSNGHELAADIGNYMQRRPVVAFQRQPTLYWLETVLRPGSELLNFTIVLLGTLVLSLVAGLTTAVVVPMLAIVLGLQGSMVLLRHAQLLGLGSRAKMAYYVAGFVLQLEAILFLAYFLNLRG